MNISKDLGYVHVYTGDGSGVREVGLGLALRAVGYGLNVVVIQFLWGTTESGEYRIQNRLKPHFKVYPFGRAELVDPAQSTPTDEYLAQEAMEYARRLVARPHERPDLLILDHANPAVHYGLVESKDMLDFMENIPANMELVLTGTPAHDEVLSRAHIVTDLQKVKHLEDRGVGSRRGIDH
ncbi:MAG: cob(I)yrinic acid a,c-diamide adenosyltransferase [Patescibacteria group bacterium]